MTYLDSLEKELKQWEQSALIRSLRHEPNLLDFSSNDYLCLNRDGSHFRLLQDVIARQNQPMVGLPEDANYKSTKAQNGDGPRMTTSDPDPRNVPFGSTGSRLIRGHWPSFERAEKAFSAWIQAPAALLFQSGYAANVGALSSLTGPGHQVFCDRLCHASLLDGVRLSGAGKHYYDHNDLNHLEDLLKTRKARKGRWILSESVFSMDGDTPDLAGLLTLCEQYSATLFLDEAHALGYYGSNESPGGGLLAHLRDKESSTERIFERVIISAPLGKAPGLMGGFVAGHPTLCKYLLNRARSFVFSTAQPPILAEMIFEIATRFDRGEYNDRIERLQRNANTLRGLMLERGWQTPSQSAIVPLIVGDPSRALELSGALQQKGMDVRAIRPPTVARNSSRLRITVHSCHSQDQLEALLDTVQQYN
ncbi:MAG: 8-amino-7-oxononanoate synthase [Leptospiraceae bacterium]|nr:8-amino-7-oxononanoate synthase [Leptospiraceae bacterium]